MDETGASATAHQGLHPCRFFSLGRHCNYGKNCRFLHVRDDYKGGGGFTVPLSDSLAADGDHRQTTTKNGTAAAEASRRPCRYFMSGHCTMEDRCRFWHPAQSPSTDDAVAPGNQRRAAPRAEPGRVPHPGSLQEVKLRDLTEGVAKQLRDTEINQLKKRFPKDQLIIQERSDGEVTYYRATVKATDPDWVLFFLLLMH